jgi:tRNA(Ile)-lysidine synthase TilS/MesJ
VGREEALRRERYRIFADVVSSLDDAVLVLAHQQGDQAETVLLHLTRGAGIRGAAGMRSLATMRVPWWDDGNVEDGVVLTVWRPLLAEPAGVVRAYAESLGLPIAEDSSNAGH